jgi:hypothetical protein
MMARQYSVARGSASCIQVNAADPISGPSTEVDAAEEHHDQRVDRSRIARLSGDTLPFGERVERAGESRETPAMAKATHCVRRHVDADGSGPQRRIARRAAVAERRADRGERGNAGSGERQYEAVVRDARRQPSGGPHPMIPLEPPVTSSHCIASDHTICAKLSVSIAM